MRLVAASTTRLGFSAIPSISVRNCETTRSLTSAPPPIPDPRWPAIESISSKKTIAGLACRARSKISRTAFSDSPT
jgi:hypothetical protein